QPLTDGSYTSARRKNSSASAEVVKTSAPRSPTKGRLLTQHTGLPPRDNGSAPSPSPSLRKPIRKGR
ncbi:MAG: hypothetical protein V4636_03260, partial [Pseudomonadota bacterium]